MIDSVNLAQIFPGAALGALELEEWSSIIDLKTHRRKWICNSVDESPTLTIFQDNTGEYWLSANFSMPKLLFGSNVTLPLEEQIKGGLDFISKYVSQKSKIEFDAWSASVFRVDYALDIRLGEDVTAALARLSRFNLARMIRHTIGDTSVYFESKKSPRSRNKQKARVIRIYDKYQEVLSHADSSDEERQAAKGILRIEYAYNTPSAVDRLYQGLSLPDKTAQTMLTASVAEAVMNKTEIKQCLTAINQTGDSRLNSLLQRYPFQKAANLSGFLNAVDLLGENFHSNPDAVMSRASYYGKARDCRNAGVWQKVNG